MRTIIIAVALLATICCQPPPPVNTELDALQWGTPPDSAAVASQVPAYMELQLIDPVSAIYRYGEPQQIWFKTSTGSIVAGYGVITKLNSRNRMGGYAGWTEYMAFFKDGIIAGVFDARRAIMKRGHTWGPAQERYNKTPDNDTFFNN